MMMQQRPETGHAKTMNIAKELPQDSSQALRMLIKFSERIMDISEKETQALVQNDMGTFAVLQDEKEYVSSHYAQASMQFRERLNEFRASDPGLLARLEDLQGELRDKLNNNNKIVERMFFRSQEKVQNSLLTVQELAQQKPVNLNNKQGV